jgi:hypothetical protein
MAAVLSRRQRKIKEPLCPGSHISLGASAHLFGGNGLGAGRRHKTICYLRCSVNALFDNRRKERLSNFGASFLIPLSGFREGQTVLSSELLDVLLLEKNQAFFGAGGVVPLTINTLGRICGRGISMPSFSAVTAYDVRGTTLLCVSEFLIPETSHRVRDKHADWDTLITNIDVGPQRLERRCARETAYRLVCRLVYRLWIGTGRQGRIVLPRRKDRSEHQRI